MTKTFVDHEFLVVAKGRSMGCLDILHRLGDVDGCDDVIDRSGKKWLICLLGILGGHSAYAAMTAVDLARLGKELTPIGAEKKGNAEGSIPEWTGGMTKAPDGFNPSKGYLDPFLDEKPKYTITADTVTQYAKWLSPGQMAMFKLYPSTYQMLVYPSHRSAAYPQSVLDAVRKEAPRTELAGDGQGVVGLLHATVPFPIPKTGLEVIWNHLTRYRGGALTRYVAAIPVQSNGSGTPMASTETIAWSSSMTNAEPNRLLYIMSKVTAPSNLQGNAYVVHEPMDQVKEPRLAWSYNPGIRRVLRAPDLAYDSPSSNIDSLRTMDDYDGFNGATDRYDWKLVGKKEMLIPYNNYKLTDKSLKYTDIIRPGHLNPALLRYELHRVWVVEATLKPGKRHLYSKRVFYLDEDTWQISQVDVYDGRGELWRSHELLGVQFYDVNVPWICGEVFYDLVSRRYLVIGLSNQEKPLQWLKQMTPQAFSAENLRRLSN